MTARDSVQALADLGFTNLEAEIYSYLLQESPATGYRIAQAIGKPAANTYKAIQSLEQKGAVIVDSSETRMCRAISSDELLTRLSREFETRRASAQVSLSKMNHPAPDDRIYQIRSRDQVFQRAREMLHEAKLLVVGVIEGPFAQELIEDLAAAIARGVDIGLKSDQNLRVEGIEAVPIEKYERGRQVLELAVDGEQVLIAAFSPEGALTHAIWSRHPVLAVSFHEGLAAQISFANVSARVDEGAGQKRLTRAVAAHRPASSTPGFSRLRS